MKISASGSWINFLTEKAGLSLQLASCTPAPPLAGVFQSPVSVELLPEFGFGGNYGACTDWVGLHHVMTFVEREYREHPWGEEGTAFRMHGGSGLSGWRQCRLSEDSFNKFGGYMVDIYGSLYI